MNFLKRAIEEAVATAQALATLQEPLERAATLVAESLKSGHKLLVCGNGGSAADAAHLSTEYLCRFVEDRRPYPALCLSSEGSLLTATGNDYSFDQIFSRQVWGLGQPGDVLIAFTTSGKSRNVQLALEEANRRDLRSIAFLGRDGGSTKGLATVDLLVEGTVTARIQEAHKLLFHVLCEMTETMLARE